ncbi:MAG: hypothetical protein ABI347_03220 [Nitrososphaera sp.]
MPNAKKTKCLTARTGGEEAENAMEFFKKQTTKQMPNLVSDLIGKGPKS